jgi:integrase
MPRPRKGEERRIRGVRKKTYTKKDGTVSVYWQYLVSVPGPDGQPKLEWRNAPSQRVAEDARAERKAEVRRGEAVSVNRLTYGAFLQEWLPRHIALKELRPSTVRGYEMVIRLYIEPELGNIPLQRLDEARVQDFLVRLKSGPGRKGKKLSVQSIRNVLTVLSASLKDAKRRRLIARNPCADLERPANKGKKDSHQGRQLTRDQARQLFPLLEGERYGPLLVLMLTAGLRRSEAIGLRWSDVDWERRVLQVRQAITDVNGNLHTDEPKSWASEREVKVPPQVVELLRVHQEHQQAQRAAAGEAWKDHDLVFCSAKGKPIFPSNVYRRFRQLLERAGIPHTGLHGLRRTASSIVNAETGDIFIAAQMLGHAHPDVTRKHYVKAREDAQELAAAAMERVLFGD